MRVIVSTLVSILFLSACGSTPKPNSSIVKVIDSCNRQEIVIKDIKGRMKENGFMIAQVSGENLTSHYKLLEYKIVWFDQDGFIIESILSNWKDVPAYATQEFHIKAIAPNPKARTFKLYLRRDKEVVCEKEYNG